MTTSYDFHILRELRQKHKWTLEDLAKASGLSYPTVASVETNKASPSLKTIDAIADALEISTGKPISLAQQKKSRKQKTDIIDVTVLKNSDINLKKINVARYDTLKIFRASVERGRVVNSMKLHDNCDCYEICYCLKGLLDIRIETETYQLGSNDVILFHGSLEHEYTALQDTEYIVIHFPCGACQLDSLLQKTLD